MLNYAKCFQFFYLFIYILYIEFLLFVICNNNKLLLLFFFPTA